MSASKTEFVQVHLKATDAGREETLMGRPFRVIPAVLVRSQILNNNLGPVYLPPEEVTDEWASAWNGIPVLIGDHPTKRGKPISGRSPELLNSRGAGWLFNASTDAEENGVRRLKAEVWLDLNRAEAVDGMQAVLDNVANGEPVELSTGFAAMIRQVDGMVGNEKFEAIIMPIGADHLVISTEFTGACGVSDGCGLGVNKKAKETALMPEVNQEQKKGWRGVLDRVSNLLGGKDDAVENDAWSQNVAMRTERWIAAINAAPRSDQQRLMDLRRALEQKVGTGTNRYVVIEDVYSAEKQVVYWISTPEGSEPPGPEYFRVSFAEGADGAFLFGEPEKVRRVMSYEPVAATTTATNSKQDSPCGCHKEETAMQENEKKELVTELTNAFQGLLKPVTERLDAVVNEAKTAATEAVNAVKAQMETAINEVKAKLEKVEAVANTVNAERDKERQALVAELAANAKTKDVYSQADLEAMPVEQLQKIAKLAQIEVANYAGRGAPRTPVVNSEEAQYAAPVPYTNNQKSKKEGE